MKTLIFTFALLSLSAAARGEEHEVCSAILVYPGNDWQIAYVECDSPYAGKCLNSITKPDGSHDWEEMKCEDVPM